jgi:non-ribosomal peptide synthetase component F
MSDKRETGRPPEGSVLPKATVFQPLHRRFEMQAQVNPGATALRLRGRQLTYGELDAQADGLAFRLQESGLRGDDFCALCLTPSFALVRAMLAVLKAGAAYVLIDPSCPPERLAALLGCFHPRLVITQQTCPACLEGTVLKILSCGEAGDDLPYAWPDEYPAHSDAPAYAIADDADGGRLDVRVVTHTALAARFRALQAAAGCGPPDAAELWWPLINGRAVSIEPDCRCGGP